MGDERTDIVAVVDLKLSQRVIDFVGQHILVPFAGSGVFIVRIGGVVGGSGVEHLLHIILLFAVVL